MSNLLKAIKTIITNPIIEIKTLYTNNNRVNAMGDALEEYIKDIFSDTVGLATKERLLKISETFSYTGNVKNPPDMMLRNGDAIEIKKIEKANSSIALNSSYPNAKLFNDESQLINSECKNCEDWKVKDMIYVIGHTSDTAINYLWFVYGDCFIANREVYERIKTVISKGIVQIDDVEFTKTNELGKVNKIDPLGITDLRIRGMWNIENPNKLFSYLKNDTTKNRFNLYCLLKKEKFDSFAQEDKLFFQKLDKMNYTFENVKIQNPNNPSQLVDSIFITFSII